MSQASIRNSGFENALRDLKARGGPAPQASAGEEIQPRYIDWFESQKIQRPRQEIIVPPKPPMAEVTRQLMQATGEQTFGLISRRMPASSRLLKAIQARVLDRAPHLGVCRVGRVIVGSNQEDELSVAEFYVTNFDAHLDTQARHFYQPTNQRGTMFFGVGVITDKSGKTKRFDHENGNDGLYFQTKDLAKAIYGIAAISTGMSIDQLMQMDRSFSNTVKKSRAG